MTSASAGRASSRPRDAQASRDVDLLVVGGGAAGLAAARTAVWLGARTALVSDAPLGGDCTWAGCVPSKSLLDSADRGLSFGEAVRAMRKVRVDIARTEDAAALGREGIEVISGRARFLSSTQGRSELLVEGTGAERNGGTQLRVRAARVVVATGGRPVLPPLAELDSVRYLTSESVFDLDDLPHSLVILGGGATGCELAQAYARFGAKVTLVEQADRLLPAEEPGASRVVQRALEADGVRVLVGGTVTAVAPTLDGGAYVGTDVGGDVAATHLLLATGRRPVASGLALDVAGARVDAAGAVIVDARLRTTASGVYAAGDVTALAPYAHSADAMGRLAARNALAPGNPFTRLRGLTNGRAGGRWSARAVPAVTFTDPEVARVGLTEAEAARLVPGARVCEVPMTAVDRARISGRTEGFVKVITGPRRLLGHTGGGVVLGATVVGPRAGEMIGELVLAAHTRMFAARLAQATHAYPTWSVGIQQAVAQLFLELDGRRARPARPDA